MNMHVFYVETSKPDEKNTCLFGRSGEYACILIETFWHILDSRADFLNLQKQIVFLLRILYGVYYFKNVTENDNAGFDENSEI